MNLQELIQNVPGFHGWGHSEKIKLFGWYLHTSKNQERFNQENLRACYDELHLEKPTGVSPYLKSLTDKKEKKFCTIAVDTIFVVKLARYTNQSTGNVRLRFRYTNY